MLHRLPGTPSSTGEEPPPGERSAEHLGLSLSRGFWQLTHKRAGAQYRQRARFRLWGPWRSSPGTTMIFRTYSNFSLQWQLCLRWPLLLLR